MFFLKTRLKEFNPRSRVQLSDFITNFQKFFSITLSLFNIVKHFEVSLVFVYISKRFEVSLVFDYISKRFGVYSYIMIDFIMFLHKFIYFPIVLVFAFVQVEQLENN